MCQCEACSPIPSPTWTRAWAIQCEARMVLRLKDQTAHEYLTAVELKRGLNSRRQLEQAIKQERYPRPPHGDGSPRAALRKK